MDTTPIKATVLRITLNEAPRPLRLRYPDRDVPGTCPHCGKAVFESESTLDDTYGCQFICPHCKAILMLQPRKGAGRGYTSEVMYLTLPTEEEVIMNELPEGTPTKGWDNPANEGKTKQELDVAYGYARP